MTTGPTLLRALPLGSTFPSELDPRYTILSEIAKRSSGILYEAQHRDLGVVAIKIGIPTSEGAARLREEARAMARLRGCSGIACIYEYESDPLPYIAMEYVRGAVDILDFAVDRDLSLRHKLRLFAHACEIIGHAHAAGVIHRNLKPSNIVIDAHSQPHLLDFSLALTTSTIPSASTSERGGIFGTVDFMAPEQASRDFDPALITPAADVYALGLLLYELISGRSPYAAPPSQLFHPDDYDPALRIVQHWRFDASSCRALDAPFDILRLITRALKPRPEDRFQNAGELSRAITQAIDRPPAHRALRLVPAVAASVALSSLVTPVILSTPISHTWLTLVSRAFPPPAHSQHAQLIPASIALSPDDLTWLQSAGTSHNNPDPASLAGLALHTAAARHDRRAVVIVGLPDPDHAAPALARGIAEATESGIDIMIDHAGPPESQRLASVAAPDDAPTFPIETLKSGGVRYSLAIEREDGRVVPSVALAAHASLLGTSGSLYASDYRFLDTEQAVLVSVASARSGKVLQHTCVVDVSEFSEFPGPAGTRRAAARFLVPTDNATDASTTDSVPPCLILNLAPTSDESAARRAQAHLNAIESLANAEKAVVSAPPLVKWSFIIGAAFLGAVLAGPRRHHAVLLIADSMVIGGLGVIGASVAIGACGVLLNPVGPIVALVMAMPVAGSMFSVNRLFRSHERAPRAGCNRVARTNMTLSCSAVLKTRSGMFQTKSSPFIPNPRMQYSRTYELTKATHWDKMMARDTSSSLDPSSGIPGEPPARSFPWHVPQLSRPSPSLIFSAKSTVDRAPSAA